MLGSSIVKNLRTRFLRQQGYDLIGKRRFLSIFLDLHNSCNLACRMCHFGFKKDKPKSPHFIKMGDFKRLAENMFPFTSELALSPCTEPLFYQDFIGLLKVIGQYKIPYFWLMTNATLLTEEIVIELIKAETNRLLISFDSHIKEIYERIKIGSNFEKVVANIEMVNRLKQEHGTEYPKINFNCLLMRSNIEHVIEYLEFIKSIGGTKVGFFHVIIFKDALKMKGESLFHHKKIANKYLEKIPKKAREIGIEIERLPGKFFAGARSEERLNSKERPHGHDIPKCRYPWYLMVADCYGNIRPCEFWFGQESFGNSIEDSLNNIWNNSRYRRLRKELLTGRLTRSCCINCVSMSSLNGRVDDESAFLEVEG